MKQLALVAALFCVALAAPYTSDWIIVFHNNVDAHTRYLHANRFEDRLIANYSFGEFNGFAARLTQEELGQELESQDVAYMERDQPMYASQTCKVQPDAVWGLNRISERQILLEGDYKYDDEGAGVQAFIVDTGILITHNEFKGRAVWGANYVNDGRNSDCNGHGTHVAGTVAGTTYGVAKQATVIAVKVLGCTGSGTTAGVVSGVQYVANNKKGKPSVANMSLGGGFSKALNDAVAAAVKAGVTFVVAAGNEDTDACYSSPASEPLAVTVGATDVDDSGFELLTDIRSSFSNYGKCVKILAPGTLIKSAWYTSNTATNTISGTSMASPHVCGAAALYVGANPNATPAEVEKHLVSISTGDLINMDCVSTNSICKATPNKLLYSACD